MIGLVRSPWLSEFQRFAASVQRRALLAAPYVTKEGWDAFAEALESPGSVRVDLYSCLRSESAATGSLDLKTLATAHRRVPGLVIRHVEHLHGKVYVADGERAIVTSGNLTGASLCRNKEYGVVVSDQPLVATIEADIREYGGLGSEAPPEAVAELAELAAECEALPISEIDQARERYELRLRSLRGDMGESRTGVLAGTVLHLLRRGAMRTGELHPLVQQIHPDLCDDGEERIIRGVRFGKRWKHDVRNAQQQLKDRGRIRRNASGRWELVGSAVGR